MCAVMNGQCAVSSRCSGRGAAAPKLVIGGRDDVYRWALVDHEDGERRRRVRGVLLFVLKRVCRFVRTSLSRRRRRRRLVCVV